MNQQKKPLLVTMTKEPFQPVRLYYRIPSNAAGSGFTTARPSHSRSRLLDMMTCPKNDSQLSLAGFAFQKAAA
jgi:hypothetical protein